MPKRLLTAEDLFDLTFVGDPQVSPRGDGVAYVLTQMEPAKDGYESSIYMSDWSGNNHRLSYHYDAERLIRDITPRWSPDGHSLAFLSNRTGTNQVWMLSTSGAGEAAPLTNFNGDVSEFSWSPDGKKLALTVQEETETSQQQTDVKEVTRLRYKEDGTRDFLEARKHIVLFDLETNTYKHVTEGDSDFYGPCFAPDGASLLYIGSKEKDRDVRYIPSIWQYDVAHEKESLFYEGKGPIQSLAYSPDGRWVGFIGHDRGENGSYNLNVWVVSAETKTAYNVSGALDRSVENKIRVDAKYDTGEARLIWDKNSTSIYFTATNQGGVQLFQTNLNGDVSDPLSERDHTITSFDMAGDRQAVFVQNHHHSTGDIVLQDVDNPLHKKQLTHWNEGLFNELMLSTPEHFHFTSVDDLEIEGWLLRPAAFDPAKKYPLILQIHGGPHSAYGYGFQHEWQLQAAKGYAVLYMNPRGSQGYGVEFLQKVVGDWGGDDYNDLMNGLDYVVDTYDFIDRERLFATGASYGGYMTNMIAARTNRFRAFATQNAVTNLYSMFGTSDIGFYFNSNQLGGVDMWEDEETIMKFSPIRYARDVEAPMLILHNENDYRCPMEQAEQWYTALTRLGVTTRFIRFPDESHSLSSKGKPSHRLERLNVLM